LRFLSALRRRASPVHSSHAKELWLTLQSTETLLHRLGWDDGWEAAFAEHRAAGLIPARVAIQHRGAYDLITEEREVRASASTRLFKLDELPAVGDWVGLDTESNLVEAVAERRTAISRKEVLHAVREQVLAANIDVAFLVQALPLDFNVRRLERYLAMAWESGAQPVVLLTKADLVDDVQPYLDQAEATTLGACPALAVSAVTGQGIEELRAYLQPNRTAVLLGSSGVGKSTIVNALVGEEVLATQEVREDDHRGRHTTTHRELILLNGGGVILDTPGIRELQLWDADLEQTFGDVEEIARRCRFSDCAHDQEPGCAIREALADGSLPVDRWQSYVKLQRELEAIEARRNHLLRQERVREYKIRTRQNRQKKKR
jgi:ribosome biogenesis GTPase